MGVVLVRKGPFAQVVRAYGPDPRHAILVLSLTPKILHVFQWVWQQTPYYILRSQVSMKKHA